MVRSMTGFARAQMQFRETHLTMELKSVNHRFREVHLHLPVNHVELEQVLKKKLEERIGRGKIHFSLRGSLSALSSHYEINEEQAQHFLNLSSKLQRVHSIEEGLGVKDLFSMPGVLLEIPEQDWVQELLALMNNPLDQLLDDFENSRSNEGLALKLALVNYVQNLQEFCDLVESRRDQIKLELRNKLTDRFSELKELGMDENRLTMEIAILVEKGDVEEEIVRLRSHLQSALDMFEKSEPIGKSLNFLVQEMHREVNTIGSKTSDHTLIHEVLDAKTAVEQIREQIQNIE